MKKLILLSTMLLLCAIQLQAQLPFQKKFISSLGFNIDHYSIETAPEGAEYIYACAGTFFDNGTTYLHVITLHDNGDVIWEQRLEYSGNDRVLDVAIDENYNVAVTGFLDNGLGEELFVSLHDANSGNVINNFYYESMNTHDMNSVGNTIIYSKVNQQYLIGGFEKEPGTSNGNGLVIALNQSLKPLWVQTYNSNCHGFRMAVVNEVVEVKDHYFITGNLSVPGVNPIGRSQVLAAMIYAGDGGIVDNKSFQPTASLGQQAMGASAYYDEAQREIVLLYNVSTTLTQDETRPYIREYHINANFSLSPIAGSEFKVEDNFTSPPSNFTDHPSFTGLKIIPNRRNKSALFFGMLVETGGQNDNVLSVYQEIRLTPTGAQGTNVAPAKYWTESEMQNGFPSQGGTYSFFNDATFISDVYTPQSTTLSIKRNNFVSIVPVPSLNSDYSFDIISSTLNTEETESDCIEEFKIALEPHNQWDDICLQEVPLNISYDQIGMGSPTVNDDYVPTCNIYRTHNTESIVLEANALKITVTDNNNVLNMSIADAGNYDILIANMEGKVFINDTYQNSGNQKSIAIEKLPKGIYILKTIDRRTGEALHKKFVKI